MHALSFTAFNLLEGSFWLSCGGMSLAGKHLHVLDKQQFWNFLALDFSLFGISDYVEAYYPLTFLDHGGEWLFAWKILCILGLVCCLVYYIVQRIKK